VHVARPTMTTVARAAGVSPMTVSNTYNRPDEVAQTTREKVLRIAGELGYSGPDPAGRSLRRRRADTVGVLLTEELPYAFDDPGTVMFLHGLATGLAEAGQALLLLPTEGNAEHASVRNALVDAFVLASLGATDPVVADVLGRRLPVVTWGGDRLTGAPRIGVDNVRGAEKAAEHLLELGHKRFGIVTFSGPRGLKPAVRQRVSGFTRVLRTAGIDPASVPVVDAARNARAACARITCDLLADSGPLADRRPTAIFAVTDQLALGVLDGAASSGVRVPDELSVVGFDNVDASASMTPPLTTVAQELFEQGKVAAKVALDLVAGRPARSQNFDTKLIIRGSTARPSRRR